MKRIIVNADDFGITEVVTAEIERQIIAGRVSSTSIMANGSCLDEVKRFAHQHPEVSFGVHLCLSEFDSLSKSGGLKEAGITDDEGRFIHKAIFCLNNLNKHAVLQAIYDELNAQIDVIEALGIPISHADSHHHVHTIFPLKEVFGHVLKQRGINKIRIGANFRSCRTRLHLRQWTRRIILNRYYSMYFVTADSFYSYSEFLATGSPIQNGKTVELMCHPGHTGDLYKNEIIMMEQVPLPEDIKLISYNELH